MPRPRRDGTPSAMPNKRALSPLFLKSLQPAAKLKYLVWDTRQPGLVVVVQPTGHAAFKCVKSRDGKRHWYHIGNVGTIGLADARKLAARVIAAPLAEKERRGGKQSAIVAKWEEFAKRGVNPTCFLYRHYDARGDLLYVGMSLSVMSRQFSHFKNAVWANSIYQIIIEPFSTRDELVEAEKLAIQIEFPKFNISHNERLHDQSDLPVRRQVVASAALKLVPKVEKPPEVKNELMTTKAVAEWLGVSVSWLEQRRAKGEGPPARRLGPRSVGYTRADIQAWLDERTYSCTSEYPPELRSKSNRNKKTETKNAAVASTARTLEQR